MNDLQIFNSQEFGTIRTVQIDNEPWFVAKDITSKLGYVNGKDAVARLVDDEDKRIFLRSEIPTLEISNRGMTFVNESGLYALTLSSKLQSAKKFRHWVTSEVLPSIRQTGGYQIPRTYSEALRALADKVEENQKLFAENKEMIPKARFYDAVSSSEESILVRDLAKILKQNGLEIGEHRLYDRMRADGYICKNSTEPTQRAMELKLFERVIRTVQVGDGSPREILTTKVTAKGQQYFLRKYLGH